ncbi:FAD-dependent oxidoreductase [Acidiferrobacter thiooxydans]|uniref:FAD/NAD(P)-binding domain-containing protein n=1 Tax=Acidiferrobacter thiooxydans TaxID=163359 RepID=A0A368HG21_9GAMM|nr:FAD-dependent oxidoreductase [Acidiferrobacter thiooxydans]RCN56431.1 hypothetical protein C4900_11465 [Acidiferrobacter thiooxydans]
MSDADFGVVTIGAGGGACPAAYVPDRGFGVVATLPALLDPAIRIVANAGVTVVERARGVRVLYMRAGKPSHTGVVMAVGRRRPVIPEGFVALDLAFDQHGIRADAAMQTGAPHIYACGDVNR